MLTHRKVWAGHTFAEKQEAFAVYLNRQYDLAVRKLQREISDSFYGFSQMPGEVPIGYFTVERPQFRLTRLS